MPTITIPRNLHENENLTLVPSGVYEDFLAWQKKIKSARTFKPTRQELKELARAREDFKKGNYIEWEQLKHELAYLRQKKSRKTTQTISR